jgi:polar amino acid transport system substrate-binding protein
MVDLGLDENTLRVGIAVSPAPSASFAARDPASGKPRGVAVALGTALAQAAGATAQFVEFPNSGELTEAVAAGRVDIAFMPMDAERTRKVDFTPPYVLFESTFLVLADSPIKSLADVDRSGVRPAGIANTTTARSAVRFLKNTTLVEARAVDRLAGMLTAGEVDAIALSRESLASLARMLPPTRILDGQFHASGVGAAVRKGRPALLQFAGAFIETAKASGLVRRALDDSGLNDTAVAPPGPLG